MSKHFAKIPVPDALNMHNSHDVNDIHTTSICASVLICRAENDKCDGPFSLLDSNGKDIGVLTSKGDQKFESTVVKPFLTSLTDNGPNQNQATYQQPASNASTYKIDTNV